MRDISREVFDDFWLINSLLILLEATSYSWLSENVPMLGYELLANIWGIASNVFGSLLLYFSSLGQKKFFYRLVVAKTQ